MAVEFRHIMEHIEVYENGKFLLSGDTMKEAREDYYKLKNTSELKEVIEKMVGYASIKIDNDTSVNEYCNKSFCDRVKAIIKKCKTNEFELCKKCIDGELVYIDALYNEDSDTITDNAKEVIDDELDVYDFAEIHIFEEL